MNKKNLKIFNTEIEGPFIKCDILYENGTSIIQIPNFKMDIKEIVKKEIENKRVSDLGPNVFVTFKVPLMTDIFLD